MYHLCFVKKKKKIVFRYKMDPIHLYSEELDYELALRGVFNVASPRLKTQALREFLKRENVGEQTVHETIVESLNSEHELASCSATIDNVVGRLEDSSLGESIVGECHSRLVHVLMRLSRIKAGSSSEQECALELRTVAETQLTRLVERASGARTGAVALTVEQATTATESRAGAAQTGTAPARESSPLADIVEQIGSVRQQLRANDELGAVGRAHGGERLSLNPHSSVFKPRKHSQTENPFSRVGRQQDIGPLADLFREMLRDEPRGHVASNAPFLQRDQAQQNAPLAQHERANYANSLSSAGSVHDEPRRVEGQRIRNFLAQRKTVPVHLWKISYSGDGQGLHLYDFLAELGMFQRSEGVTDDELFASVVHLLTGRARLWYRSWFDTFACWAEFVTAIKKEFLPPKYDYRLLSSISSRRQKQHETFAEYLGVMRSLFNYLSIPIDEQHKLCIIEENMLAKYTIAVSAIEITTLDQLSNVCRRIDFAYNKQSVVMPRDDVAPPTRTPFRHSVGRSREVHEVERRMNPMDDISGFGNCQFGANDGQRQDQQPENDAPLAQEVMATTSAQNSGNRNEAVGEDRCFNCLKTGHVFAKCTQQRKGTFCFRCGSRDVTVFTCRKCTKNGETGSAQGAAGPSPQNK